MANNRRKTAAIAFAVLGVAGLSLASASTLNLTGGTLQAGVTDLTDCQSGTVTATVAAGAFQASPRGFKAGNVTLSGLTVAGATNCQGKTVTVALLDASNAQIGSSLTGTVGATATLSIANTGTALASDVKAVAVVIS